MTTILVTRSKTKWKNSIMKAWFYVQILPKL